MLFLDIEASGLDERSYPIEVGWITENGSGDSVLICPAWHWTYWSYKAEQVHRLSQEELARSGLPVATAAGRVADAVHGRTVYVDAPEWDGHWLRMLFSEAGLSPEYALRDISEVLTLALAPLASSFRPVGTNQDPAQREAHIARLGQAILVEARDHADRTAPRRHRALADVLHTWTMWQRVSERVAELAPTKKGEHRAGKEAD